MIMLQSIEFGIFTDIPNCWCFFFTFPYSIYSRMAVSFYIYNYMYKLFVVYVIFILSIYWIISIIFKGNTQLFSGLLSPIVGVNDSPPRGNVVDFTYPLAPGVLGAIIIFDLYCMRLFKHQLLNLNMGLICGWSQNPGAVSKFLIS